MIKIEHKYRMAIASKIMPARLIFDEKGPDQKLYTPVEGQEAVAPTPKKVADEKQKLDEKKIALQGRIDLYK